MIFISVTTLTALLALHIETALNPSETELVRSRARISISQTMLVLNQAKEFPALRKALPVFEEILARKNICSPTPPPPASATAVSDIIITGQSVGAVSSVDMAEVEADGNGFSFQRDDGMGLSHQTAVVAASAAEQQGEGGELQLFGNCPGFDFLDDWALDNWASLVDVNMDFEEQRVG